MKSRITELLGIKYPIFQGGMAWVADGDLAGAVSNAGGLGIIGGGNAPKEVVKANIDKIKSLTDKPFGVNIMLLSPFVDDIVDLVIEEGVKVVTTGAGNPGKYMERFHEAGITVIPVVPSVALAKRMEKLGADAVVAEGMEAGGHIGKLTTMALVRQVADAVSIPVIGAGGVLDGRDIVEMLKLGASGVQMGSRFAASDECNASDELKKMYVRATNPEDIVLIQSPVGLPGQAIKNKFAESVLDGTVAPPTVCDNCLKHCSHKFCIIRALSRAQQGDVETGLVFSGNNMRKVDKIMPVKDIFAQLKQQVAEID